MGQIPANFQFNRETERAMFTGISLKGGGALPGGPRGPPEYRRRLHRRQWGIREGFTDDSEKREGPAWRREGSKLRDVTRSEMPAAVPRRRARQDKEIMVVQGGEACETADPDR